MNSSLKIYPNLKKLSTKSGGYPLYIRVIRDSQKAEGKIPNISIKPTELVEWDCSTETFGNSKSIINMQVMAIKNRYNQIIAKSFFESHKPSAKEIRDILLQWKKKQSESVLDFITDYYIDIVVPSTIWSKSTKKLFRRSINHFTKFLKYKDLSTIKFEDVRFSLGDDFFNYLTSNHSVFFKPVTKESAATIIKKINYMFKVAIREEKTNINPFSELRIRIQHKPKPKLNLTDIKKIFCSNLSERPTLDFTKDLLIFQLFTGLSYSDLVNLKATNFSKTIYDREVLTYYRQKTKLEGRIIIHPYLRTLMKKYKNHPKVINRDNVLPSISLKEYNYRLKLLSDLLNLSVKNLSTHIGRHTFRQLLTEAKIVDIGSIYTFMAWSRKKFMDSIYSNITDEQLIDAMKKLEFYFEKNKIFKKY